MCPLKIDELRQRGAIEAPINSIELREGKRGKRGPRAVRVWTTKAAFVENGKVVQKPVTYAYSVPKNLDSLRKQMRNAIERDHRLNEIRGEGQDGVYYATVYNPRKEGPVPKEPVKEPADPCHEVSDTAKYVGDYVSCPACNGALRRVLQEEADQDGRHLTLECNHCIVRE